MGDDEEGEDVESHGEKPESLDDFLRQMHETTTLVTDENGVPTNAWLKDNFKSKSGIIRYLKHIGLDPKQISKHTGFKYQHCYNVYNQYLKRGPNEVYVESKWQCPHDKAATFVDVIVRRGLKDPDSSRILYRVCTDCAKGIIPGVTEDSLKAALPGVHKETEDK